MSLKLREAEVVMARSKKCNFLVYAAKRVGDERNEFKDQRKTNPDFM